RTLALGAEDLRGLGAPRDTPEEAASVTRPAEGEGAAAVHGRPADWLALATDEWTLVFAGATGDTRADPWWVRTGEHPGVGSALASDRPLPLAPADTVTRRIVTAITDGRSTPETAARLAAQLSDRGAAV
ncbi:DUF6807 family protein, partial [Streptomyces antimycoticus]|uniref:DUF6807 family protein n=1 Tax=Streptomyces antimycoticus TaxID=68175 RepID=UPI001F1593E6